MLVSHYTTKWRLFHLFSEAFLALPALCYNEHERLLCRPVSRHQDQACAGWRSRVK